MMNIPAVRHVSECFIKPQHPIEESNQMCYLAPGDIAMLSAHYIQKGLLFKKPAPLDKQQDFIENLLDKLKHSLSRYNEFGMGKAMAVQSGYANKYDGKVTSYPGYEGGGSVDLEVCLLPDTMSALESDEEFMNSVSASHPLS